MLVSPDWAQYLPPVLRPGNPPQTIISLSSPDCRVRVSGIGCIGGAGGCPTISAGIISSAGIQIADDRSVRPRRSFRCRSRLLCDQLGHRARWWCWWLSKLSVLGSYLPPVLKRCIAINSAPDDHFTAGPHRRVTASSSGRVGGAGGCPTVGARDCICPPVLK